MIQLRAPRLSDSLYRDVCVVEFLVSACQEARLCSLRGCQCEGVGQGEGVSSLRSCGFFPDAVVFDGDDLQPVASQVPLLLVGQVWVPAVQDVVEFREVDYVDVALHLSFHGF